MFESRLRPSSVEFACFTRTCAGISCECEWLNVCLCALWWTGDPSPGFICTSQWNGLHRPAKSDKGQCDGAMKCWVWPVLCFVSKKKKKKINIGLHGGIERNLTKFTSNNLTNIQIAKIGFCMDRHVLVIKMMAHVGVPVHTCFTGCCFFQLFAKCFQSPTQRTF